MSAAAARASRETLLDGFPLNFLYVVDDSREGDEPGLVGVVDDDFITLEASLASPNYLIY